MLQNDELLKLARLGSDIEAELETPLFKYVLGRMVDRVEELKEKLVDLCPEQQSSEIRNVQAEIKRFSCMQQDIEQIVNDGRQAYREIVDQEQVEDL
tara:strand:+ start:200 stop:490 length:291 start_codon:yes stop_codon:yes gene_type:complete